MADRSLRRWGQGARSITAALVVLLLCGGCAFGPASTAPAGATSTSRVIGATVFAAGARHQVPAVRGATLAGGHLALRDLAGHGLLVVNVWASWCASCRDESAALAELARTSAGTGTTFVGIDEQDTSSAARAFVATSGATYPQLFDPDGRILAQLPVLPSFGIPSTLIIDRDALMAARFVGAVTRAKLQALITSIRSEPGAGPSH